MFSAVALVAFSFAGMANTGGEENNTIKINQTVEKKETLSDTPCADQWSSDVDFFMDYLGVSLRKAMRLADLAFEDCLDDVYGG